MKFENTEIFNFEGAFRGMRNPMNSWDKSDSYNIHPEVVSELSQKGKFISTYVLGENDLKLAQSLIRAGTDHSKFMRQIMVSVDITAPLYWWKEFDTYKVGTVANSTSTMHKLATTEITKECFELDENIFNLCLDTDEEWGKQTDVDYCGFLVDTILDGCERLRKSYLKTKDKRYWRALIQLLPSSWLQTRTVTMSYQNIRSMSLAREYHKLIEWSKDFIEWRKSLPYSEKLIMYRGETI